MSDKVETTAFYMNMPVQLKARLRLIAQSGKPRRDLTGLINHVMGLYTKHILDPIEGMDDVLKQIELRTEHFSMKGMMEEVGDEQDDMSA